MKIVQSRRPFLITSSLTLTRYCFHSMGKIQQDGVLAILTKADRSDWTDYSIRLNNKIWLWRPHVECPDEILLQDALCRGLSAVGARVKRKLTTYLVGEYQLSRLRPGHFPHKTLGPSAVPSNLSSYSTQQQAPIFWSLYLHWGHLPFLFS